MNHTLRTDIIEALVRNRKAIVGPTYINKIECPSCHKREAFTSAEAPWVIKCGRANKCGESHHIKELFPELFESWTERYQPKDSVSRTKKPTAVADGYLQDGRGFDLAKIRGWYTQEYYYDHTLNAGTTTVRFQLPNGFWERLLDNPKRFGSQKARIVGEYKGLAWIPPVYELKDLTEQKEIWITEGIFNAIALQHQGICAVSSLSSTNYIGIFLSELAKQCEKSRRHRPKLVFAFDSDRAGREATTKFRCYAEESGWNVRAALPPEGSHDWNDLYRLDQMSENDLDTYAYYGDLLLAQSASEKALLMYHQNERREFWFTYDTKIWWWKLDMEAYDREIRSLDLDDHTTITHQQRERCLKNAGVVNCICTAQPKPLYFQANHITDESWYYFSVELPADGHIIKKAFTAKQLTSATEFKNRLLAIAQNAWFTGTGKQLDRIMQDQMQNIKTVETIDYIGYSKEHQAYIYNDIASKSGRVCQLNSQDYFQFGKLSIKSLANSPALIINSATNQYRREWSTHILGGFGIPGVIAIGFWLGSVFCEQIRQQHASYPFLELVGEAGAGKTTLIEFMWKLCGRADWEGLDPMKMTAAALNRYFIQVSNLPVVLIEADRDQDNNKTKQFDWDELKPAYNGRPMRSRGVKNNGNDTYEPPFRGAFVISQNTKVEASEAILSRICHITVTRQHHSPATKIHSDWLASTPVENLSGFLVEVLKQEKSILEYFTQQTARHESYLLGLEEIRMVRIAKNHGQLMALVDCLGPTCLNFFSDDTIQQARSFIEDMTKERQKSLNSDHPMVVEFWEAYDYIEQTSQSSRLNHFGEHHKHIAVNLKEFEHWCSELKLNTPPVRILKPYLRSSRSRRFVESNKAVRSQIHERNKTYKCWVFEK